jgi:hypothetical protein
MTMNEITNDEGRCRYLRDWLEAMHGQRNRVAA